MKSLTATLSFLLAAASLGATTFTYRPNDGQGDLDDIFDLDHHYAYAWGINAGGLKTELQNGATITSAAVKVDNIWDWVVESNDRLWVNLLDDPALGLKTFADNQADVESPDPTTNFFYGQGIDIGYWTDPNGGTSSKAINLSFNFTQSQINTLVSYILDATTKADFGISFDPDCHYYNTGISLVVTTAQRVPDGGWTLVLLGLAMGGLAIGSKRIGKR